jgi:RNA polymerase sigma-70 factor, ECF subfamily
MRATESPAATLEALYLAEYRRLLRVAFVMTGSMVVAEDLVQDVFMQAHRHRDHVLGLQRPDAWLRRVLVNRARSRWRRLVVEARHVSGRRDIETVAMSESAHELWDAVRGLPPRQRAVVALVFLEDRTVADAARVLGCAEETARTHMKRALQQLGKTMKAVTDED